jgi:uncharacterized protein (DUF305 family)
MTITSLRPALAAGALVLALAGCGAADDDGAGGADGAATGGATTAGPSAAPSVTADVSAEHNDADTAFAQMMVVHHEGAVEMADLAASDATTEEVRALAERISAAQGPEIDLMTTWLEQWGEPGPDEADMGGMDHGGMDMGELSQEEAMAELEAAEGVELDRRFLELMVEHHRGAVDMARDQLDAGADPAAVTLAEQIIDAQEAEIAEMESMLDDL